MYIDVSGMDVKREADSNDITECSHDYKPSVGMFVVFLMLHSLQSFLCVWLQLFSCCTCVFFRCSTSTYYTPQSQRLDLTPVHHISVCFPTIVSLTVNVNVKSEANSRSKPLMCCHLYDMDVV